MTAGSNRNKAASACGKTLSGGTSSGGTDLIFKVQRSPAINFFQAPRTAMLRAASGVMSVPGSDCRRPIESEL
eukprot:gene5267-18503_t